jgi:Mitochondrial carrier protein
MSTIQETRLTPVGQVVLTGIASIVANGVMHPLCTIKNLQMADAKVRERQEKISRLGLRQLYRGYYAICAVDGLTFAAAYFVNDALWERIGTQWSAVAATIVSTPIAAVGEGLASNRQVKGVSYAQAMRSSFRFSGLTATLLRELPYNLALFSCASRVERRLTQFSEQRKGKLLANRIVRQAVSGGVTTAIAGYLSTPFDLLRNRVQTHPENISIVQAVKSMIAQEGFRVFFKGALARSFYVGGAGAIVNVIYNTLPPLLPKSLQRE